MVRLLMSWDIKPGQEVALLTFMEKDFLPALMKADLKVTDFWSTAVGRGPQFLFGATAEDLVTINKILAGKEWHALHDKLMTYVLHFQQKVVPLHARFQL